MSPERRMLERRLAAQLAHDRAHPSRCHEVAGLVIVQPSGTAVGLAFRIGMLTGEPDTAIMDRLGQP